MNVSQIEVETSLEYFENIMNEMNKIKEINKGKRTKQIDIEMKVDFDVINKFSKFKNTVKMIKIETNISGISKDEFRDFSKLKEIIILSSVSKIRDESFENCSSLSTILIPNTVTMIGNKTFKNYMATTLISFL